MAYLATRRCVASIVARTLSSTYSLSSRSRFAIGLLDKNPLAHLSPPEFVQIPARFKTSKSGYSPLNDPSPNWSNRPPKETILLDGCDYEHWLIVLEFPTDPKPTEEEMINAYVKTLASVVGSEEEAKKKIYSVCTTTYTGFGALISEELSYKVKGGLRVGSGVFSNAVGHGFLWNQSHRSGCYAELPGVLWVLPDSYLDVPNKDYGGDLFVDGKVIHRPQFWYTDRQPTKNRPRPRYDRRWETMQVQRREPMHRQNLGPQDHGQSMRQPQSMNAQNPASGGGQFNQSNS